MIGSQSAQPEVSPSLASRPTIWGLSPIELHDRFWASRGVQVVRRGQDMNLAESAELFLLVDPHTLVIFRLRDLVELLSWLNPKLVSIRLRDAGRGEYREVVRTDERGGLLRTERIYDGLDSRLARISVTPSREVARLWQEAATASEGWKQLRGALPPDTRLARSMPGRVFDASREEELMAQLECLLGAWSQPDSTVPRAKRGRLGVWRDREASVADGASIYGKVWIGAGRRISSNDVVLGPAVLWDDPATRPQPDAVPWRDLQPAAPGGVAAPRRLRRVRRVGKRLFDILFSMVALALTLPLYPFIALAIWIEDGRPVFFAHRRETLGGREFPCLKFRSMRRDAERLKSDLAAVNASDGPQFFVEKDPRSTRVGRFLRTSQLDEIPQFLNVLLGHMSVVGPRPSPRRENQYCPAWRESRLSVRPGVTGLWQIRRTRAKGLDFQEWIRFDLEYVERMSWRLDAWIIWKTCLVVLQRAVGK